MDQTISVLPAIGALLDAESSNAGEAIERYLGAFEAGTLSEEQCGARITKLGEKVGELRLRREALLAAMSEGAADAPTEAELRALRSRVDDALKNGAIPVRKALLRALVHEIRVESRDHIVPWFRVRSGAPIQVRALADWVPPVGLEPTLTV